MMFTEQHQKAINVLCQGYKNDLVQYIMNNDKYGEVIHELIEEYINKQIPILDNDMEFELGLALMESIQMEAK